MKTSDLFPGDLLKGTGNHCFTQNIIQFIGIVNILGPLAYAEYRWLLRQMAGGEQRIPTLVGRDGAAIPAVAFAVNIIGFFVIRVYRFTPADHIDGIAIEQFQLRRKFRNIVAGAGAGGQQLHPAAAEAG